MPWIFSSPNTQITTNPLDAKQSISPFVPVTHVGTSQSPISRGTSLVASTNTVNYPVGAAAGDLAILVCHINAVPATPSGYTFIGQYNAGFVCPIFYRFLTGAEGSSVPVTFSSLNGDTNAVSLTVLRGAALTAPFAATSTTVTQSVATTSSVGPSNGLTIGGGGACLAVASHYTQTTGLTYTSPISNNGLSWVRVAEIDPYDHSITNAGGGSIYLALNSANSPVVISNGAGPTITWSPSLSLTSRSITIFSVNTANI